VHRCALDGLLKLKKASNKVWAFFILKSLAKPGIIFNCGENGIRTHEPLLAITHFPGVRLRPLGHLSLKVLPGRARKNSKKKQ
jgi:hypothetical protein